MNRSRLDRMIARLSTQRAALQSAAERIAAVTGPVVELGLGKGRTYTHLREMFEPERPVYVLDAAIHAPADAVPPEPRLVLGDFCDSLGRAQDWLPSPVALFHLDTGSEDPSRDAALIAHLSPLLAPLMAPGGVVVSDRRLESPELLPEAAPSIEGWEIFVYRRKPHLGS